MREPILQPPGSKLCGHIAVAVITGAPLADVCKRIGHYKGTKTHELVRVLESYGYGALGRARRRSTPPKLGLAIMRPHGRRGGNWHWVVVEDGRIIDGQPHSDDWRITSYVPVFEP